MRRALRRSALRWVLTARVVALDGGCQGARLLPGLLSGSADCSIAIAATIAVPAMGPDRTIARRAIRPTGAATAIAIRTATSADTNAIAATSRTDSHRSRRAVATDIAAPSAASRPRVAAAIPATRTTTSIPVRPWLKRLIRTTRCAARATSCSTTRRRWDRIETGRAEAGRWKDSSRTFPNANTVRSREGIHALSAADGARMRQGG